VADGQPVGQNAAKIALRDQLLTARHRLSLAEIGQAARGLRDVLMEASEVRRAATVAAYVSVGSEPGTGPLLEALVMAGKRVLLPCLLPDGDLDWAVYDAGARPALVAARRGLLEPSGARSGPAAIAGADVVLVPGLAASAGGDRLGRGGGSYDRALARVPVGTPVVVLLYDGEADRPVPVEPHDRPVAAVATPSGIRYCR
jgi:5-formyltetrahydrofolate cyclo-ligase